MKQSGGIVRPRRSLPHHCCGTAPHRHAHDGRLASLNRRLSAGSELEEVTMRQLASESTTTISSTYATTSVHRRVASAALLLLILPITGCSNQQQKAEEQVRAALQQQEDGEYEDAIRTLTRGIALKPDYAEAFYLRGTCRGAIGDLPAAIEDLKVATELKPNWDRAWWALGTM